MDDESLDTEEMLESTDNFEAAYRAHAPKVYRFLFWRTQDVQLSEDLTSNVFEKAWRSRSTFHGGSPQAWLYRIARNTLTDHWRKNKEFAIDNVEDLGEEHQVSSGELLDKKLRVQELQKALAALPNDMRSVVTLRFIEGLSCRQVAQKLGLSESNVRVIQYRALKKLKDFLS
jgi:RNA polymerase sigma-70 factor (ECF subfamily)